MLVRLVYLSTLAPEVSSDDVDRIVGHSAIANERRNITGILALENERVCQILEGEMATVDGLYETIRQDPRHGELVLLDRQSIEKPHFGAWGMRRGRMVDVVTLAFSL